MIEVNNLCFKYSKADKQVISNLSFHIEKGEIFGFLGPSGAGKTTTQRLIIGLLRNYEGQICVLGKERKNWGRDFFERIGVAFDFPNLYLKLTAEENLKLIGNYYTNKNKSIEQMLDKVGLLPDKSVRVEAFSKGMKMRLNFVRSLMHDPDLLFFDEPTSGLDPVNAHTVKEIILEEKSRGKTVFLTTHNMTVAEQLCDRVAFIVDGQIVITGSPKELMIEHGKRRIKVEFTDGGRLCFEEFELDSLGGNKRFIEILQNGNVKTIHSCEATLEDIFIKMTGRVLL